MENIRIIGRRGKLKNIYYSVLKVCPLKLKAYIEIARVHHKIYSAQKPYFFCEKIQWLKIHHKLEQFTQLADKYAMREFVTEKIGNEYLIPLLGVWNDTSEIDFNKLPDQFVLKANHGQGYNMVCKCKKQADPEKMRRILNQFLKEDYAAIKGELQYKNIPRKIICETYLEDETGDLADYKFFCAFGTVKMFGTYRNRNTQLQINYYYPDKTDFGIISSGKYLSDKNKYLPVQVDRMMELAGKLSTNIPFVRVDFYLVEDKIYVGEMTLTPGGGSDPFFPLEKDLEIASWVDLSKY